MDYLKGVLSPRRENKMEGNMEMKWKLAYVWLFRGHLGFNDVAFK